MLVVLLATAVTLIAVTLDQMFYNLGQEK